MAVIDVVKWNATEDIYAWKFPSEELSTWTQMIVSETQEAVFLSEGRMLGPFKAGRHTLDTKNFPVISKFFKIPMGGKSPFTNNRSNSTPGSKIQNYVAHTSIWTIRCPNK